MRIAKDGSDEGKKRATQSKQHGSPMILEEQYRQL
jgi:hypothetical protein